MTSSSVLETAGLWQVNGRQSTRIYSSCTIYQLKIFCPATYNNINGTDIIKCRPHVPLGMSSHKITPVKLLVTDPSSCTYVAIYRYEQHSFFGERVWRLQQLSSERQWGRPKLWQLTGKNLHSWTFQGYFLAIFMIEHWNTRHVQCMYVVKYQSPKTY